MGKLMAPESPDGWVRKLGAEFRSLLGIALYFWVLFTLFAFHKAILTNDRNIALHLGVALINSKIMAKVVFIGERTSLSKRIMDRPLIFTILSKAFVFSIVLFIVRICEEILIGLWDGRTIYEILIQDHPKISNSSGFIFIAMGCTIIFVALIPFFAYLEVEEALSKNFLRDLLFRKKLKDFRREAFALSAQPAEPRRKYTDFSECETNAQEIWYLTETGAIKGPLSAHECQSALKDGILTSSTMVYLASQENEWKPLREYLFYDPPH